MSKFWEKTKDFLYDSVDYLLMLLVIAIVAGIIGWRLDILFANDLPENVPKKDEIEASKEKETQQNKDSDSTKKDNEETVKIVIPKGSSGEEIADILLEKNLIKDKKEFLETAEKTKLVTKLKPGEFEIKSNSSYEEILNILSK